MGLHKQLSHHHDVSRLELVRHHRTMGECKFFHPGLKKAEADDLLMADGGAGVSGKFLLRPKGKTSDFVLSVIYKGNPTHHMLLKVDGEYTLNNQPTGHSDINDVVEHFRAKRPKWPVPLTEGVTYGKSKAESKRDSGLDQTTSAASSDDSESCPFLHMKCSKGNAEQLLLADDGDSVSGKFLVRSKGGSANDYILSVIYKGAPTHHVLAREGPGSEFSLNKQPTGEKTLNGVLETYKKKRPKWPVPLTKGVKAKGGAKAKGSGSKEKGGGTAARASTTKAAPPAQAGGVFNFLHQNISKSQADELLLANGGSGTSGKFLVRSKGSSGTSFVLSVIYKGAPTHHILAQESVGGEFLLNKQPTGETTIAGVVQRYRTKQPKWPVPLTEGVSSGDDGGGSTASGTVTPPASTATAASATRASSPPPQQSTARSGRSTPRASAPPSRAASPPPPVQPPAPVEQAPAEPELVSFDMSEYYHGKLSQSDAEKILLGSTPDTDAKIKSLLSAAELRAAEDNPTLLKDGKFLFRESMNIQSDYILSVLKRGAVVHHALVKAGGVFKLDGLSCGSSSTLEEVVLWAMAVRPGWAVPVRAGVPGLACATDEEILEQRMRVEMAREAQRAPVKMAQSKPDLLARYTDRSALVQQEAAEQQQREQEMYEARRQAESEAKKAAMERLNARMSGGDTGAPGARPAPAVDEAALARRREQDLLLQRRLQELQELPDVSARAAQADGDVSDESDPEDDPNDGRTDPNDELNGPQDVGYLEVNDADYKSKVSTFVNALYHHGDLGRADAESILFEQIETHGTAANGRFLVRSARGDEQIISVVHDGAPMHHRLLRASDGCFTVSGQETSQRDLNSLLVLLSQSDIDWWPSPLTDAIEPVQKHTRKMLTKKHSVRVMQARKTLRASMHEDDDRATSPTGAGAARPTRESLKRKGSTKTRYTEREKAELQRNAIALCKQWENDLFGPVSAPTFGSSVGSDTDPVFGPFFHKGITVAQANERLGTSKGNFLLRYKTEGDDTQIVVTTVFKGQPTHHLLTRAAEGANFMLNNIDLGVATITGVVAHLSEKHPYWPIRLTHGIPPPERSERAKLSPQERYEHEQRKLQAREQARPFIRAEVAGGLMGGIAELMYSEEIEYATSGVMDSAVLKELKAAMAQFVAAEVQFDEVLQRQHKAENQMSAAQTGNADGMPGGFRVAKWNKGVGAKSSNTRVADTSRPADSLVPANLKIGGWRRPGGSDAPPASDKAPVVEKTPVVAVAPKAKSTPGHSRAPSDSAPAAAAGGSDSGGGEMRYVHGALRKSEAESLLLANDGANVPGKFLVRAKAADSADKYVVSVIYKGAPTHHMLVREGAGAEFTLNKNPTGQTTVAAVIEHFRAKRPKWPVPLTEGVPSGGGGGGGEKPKKVSSRPSSRTASAPESRANSDGGDDSISCAFLHPKLKKSSAEALLLADGGDSVPGKFLIRPKAGTVPGDEFVLSVIYKGAPTHHMLVRDGPQEEFTLNKNPTGEYTLDGVVRAHRSKRPKWPVPLTDGVAA
eukprot:m.988954 g.988954  ORF g.988954 m.988954 type:complete len:1536 (+) comp23994_c0_seq4:216-4823(+)